MINLTDLTGLNQSFKDLGISINDNGQSVVNVVVQQQSLTFMQIMFYAYCIFIVALLCHEIGHYLALRRHSPDTAVYIYFKGWKPHMQTGEESDYAMLTPKQKIEVYMWGIIGGGIPLLFAVFVHPLYLVLFGPYIVGLLKDIEKIKDNWGKQ